MELNKALDKIRGDNELTKSFLYNPKDILENLDVDTTKLKIEPVTEPTSTEMLKTDVCASIGALVCVSVGDSF